MLKEKNKEALLEVKEDLESRLFCMELAVKELYNKGKKANILFNIFFENICNMQSAVENIDLIVKLEEEGKEINPD